ncbi:TPA: hypothetical protein N0F65_006113 [Lagenidium giganteum]|uniref:glucan 1,3-beta-glucosidase n=1 Tax=Lagenidium giganteum TaxID=4803 RepID=A0AAV2Z0N8_9STRA|nr:TPA: hypothetical protein N0F65_006113 [Lagenidium giganteum]
MPLLVAVVVAAVITASFASSSAAAASSIRDQLRSGQLPVRGVNLGGWLVAEHWMTWDSSIWQGVPDDVADQGEYATMTFLGHAVGDARFEQHRQQWITEDDIRELAGFGLNTVRVPIGFWIVGNDSSDPSGMRQWQTYAPGALKYLDTLVNEWAPRYNIAVMMSLHAHKGSQNGRDHSAPTVLGTKYWSTFQENVDNSVHWAMWVADRYKNSAAFLGLNLMNEPEDPTDLDVLLNYYRTTYALIRATGNDCVIGVSPWLTRQTPAYMMDFMNWPQYYNVWHEWHPYFVWGYDGLTEQQLIDAVQTYVTKNIAPWTGNYLFFGEWSMGSPISAAFKDDGDLKRFGQAQVRAFQGAHQGWSFWSWRHSDDMHNKRSGWSMRALLRSGLLVL